MTALIDLRRRQVREAAARYRKRRKRGLQRVPIDVTNAQLDALEERGYLDPGPEWRECRRVRRDRGVPSGRLAEIEIGSEICSWASCAREGVLNSLFCPQSRVPDPWTTSPFRS